MKTWRMACGLAGVLAASAGAQGLGTVDPIPVPARSVPKQIHLVSPGPWGRLEYYFTYLEAPDFLLRFTETPSQETVWFFKGESLEEVGARLREAGLGEDVVTVMQEEDRCQTSGAGTRLFPPESLLRELSQDARSRIYVHLAQWPENRFHHRPIVIEDSRLDRWFEGSRIGPRIQPAMERMVWSDGTALVFSDVPSLLRLARTGEEETAILRALTRTRTLVLRMRLSPSSDLGALTNYWTAGGVNPGVRPILEAVAATEGVENLDILHLLPPFPRKHLYSFPSGADGFGGRFPDGFWSATNFFAARSMDRYLDDADFPEFLEAEYVRVTPPFTFGDVLLLLNKKDEKPVHACAYVAGEILFTKNRPDRFSPWVLMTLDDMLAHHQRGRDLLIRAFRRRETPR